MSEPILEEPPGVKAAEPIVPLGDGSERVFDAQSELQRQQQVLKNIAEKHVPVSEARLNKIMVAIRETVDEFSHQLMEEQESRRLQNEKIASLAAEVESLRQQVIMMTATAPKDNSEIVNDLGNRVLELERGHGRSDD